MSSGLAASDIVRAMMRAGYPRGEIYDLLVETGLNGEQAQLLIERVAVELHMTNIESRPSRVAAEVSKVFLDTFNNFIQETRSRDDLFSLKQNIIINELEKLRQALTQLAQQAREKNLKRTEKSARR
ncbi:MAG: hypothetical protein QXP01_06545 [Candidatus Hadarchaeum sp.]